MKIRKYTSPQNLNEWFRSDEDLFNHFDYNIVDGGGGHGDEFQYDELAPLSKISQYELKAQNRMWTYYKKKAAGEVESPLAFISYLYKNGSVPADHFFAFKDKKDGRTRILISADKKTDYQMLILGAWNGEEQELTKKEYAERHIYLNPDYFYTPDKNGNIPAQDMHSRYTSTGSVELVPIEMRKMKSLSDKTFVDEVATAKKRNINPKSPDKKVRDKAKKLTKNLDKLADTFAYAKPVLVSFYKIKENPFNYWLRQLHDHYPLSSSTTMSKNTISMYDIQMAEKFVNTHHFSVEQRDQNSEKWAKNYVNLHK